MQVHRKHTKKEVDPAWALFESAARIDDDCDIAEDKGSSRDYDFPEKIIVSCAGMTHILRAHHTTPHIRCII